MLGALVPVVLAIHVIITIFLIGIILTQKNEGGMGGLGGGASGGMAGFLSGRAQSNLLTKVTKWLAVGFFCTSLFLAYVDSNDTSRQPLVGASPASTEPQAPIADPAAPVTTGGDSGTVAPAAPAVPAEPVAPSGQ